MRSMKLLLLLLLSLAYFYGCTAVQTRFAVSIDSLASPLAGSNTTFILLPGNDGVGINDLQFREYANYLTRALTARGYTLANSVEEADLAIILSYGISDPQTQQYSYSTPVYGKTGVKASTTLGFATTIGNMTTLNTTTNYVPSYGVTGYKTHTGTKTKYLRYAFLSAYDFKQFKETEKEVQLWQTTITSIGSSVDLRRVFPILIGASVPYLGASTSQKVNVSMGEDDTVVKAVKGFPVE